MAIATQVGPDTFVSLAYTLYDEDGAVLETVGADDPLEFVFGYGQVVPGLEAGIESLVAGQKKTLTVPAEEAYGPYDDDAVFEVERSEFPDPATVQVEDEFVAEGPDGDALPLRVVEVREDAIVVDANHPLAGENLRFELEVIAVRAATTAEIEEAEEALEASEGCCDDPEHHHHEPADVVPLGRKPSGTPPSGGAA